MEERVRTIIFCADVSKWSEVKIKITNDLTPSEMADDEDWGITPDYKNVMTEKEQRFGSQAVPGRVGHVDVNKLIQGVLKSDAESKKNSFPKASYGYGGKFGVEKDRMDKSAVGTDYRSEMAKHSSQQDYSKGFGGRYGVQKDRQDKAALGYEHREELSKHSSQKDYAVGFGGKYGVQKDRVDASSVGYGDAPEPSAPHQSQQRAGVGTGQNRASELRARFEKLALDRNKPVERPSRPQVGRLKPNIFTHPMSAEEPKSEPKPAKLTPKFVSSMAQAFEKKKAGTQEEEKTNEGVDEVWKSEPVHKFVKPPSPESEPEVEEQSEKKLEEHEEMEPSYQPSQPTEPTEYKKTSNITAVAAFDFNASQSDELSFRAGDTIVNIDKFDESWWSGCIGTRWGIFPANHVREIKSEAAATGASAHSTSNTTATALYDFVASQSDELSFKVVLVVWPHWGSIWHLSSHLCVRKLTPHSFHTMILLI
uniref:Hematopoietic lineage cell specific protein n=1 Tax=Echinococcus granulosus TaxID=6210 RepID=A0A068WXR6_ECHGR|nr:hematopoietic lineage cell specific protein [Echinococcus granulosus]